MKVNVCLKSYWILLAAIVCCLQACSDDEENGGGSSSSILKQVSLSEQTYSVAEDGTFNVSFTVEPANAEVTVASISPTNLPNGNPFEVASLSKEKNGNWTAHCKTSDLALLQAEQTLSLYLKQEMGSSATASFKLKDPYTIEGQFEVSYPYSVSFCDVETQQAIGLPIVFTAKEGGDLSKIKNYKVIVSNLSLTDLVKESDFGFMKMAKGHGIAIQIKQETVNNIFATASYIPAQFEVYALTEQGRAAKFHVHCLFATPYEYVDNEELVFKRSDLLQTSFEKTIDMDMTHTLKRLGLTNGSGNTFDLTEVKSATTGIFTSTGDLVDEAPNFILLLLNNDVESSLQLMGDENIPESGDYYHGTHVSLDWTCGDYIYPRIRGELRINLSITE